MKTVGQKVVSKCFISLCFTNTVNYLFYQLSTMETSTSAEVVVEDKPGEEEARSAGSGTSRGPAGSVPGTRLGPVPGSATVATKTAPGDWPAMPARLPSQVT